MLTRLIIDLISVVTIGGTLAFCIVAAARVAAGF